MPWIFFYTEPVDAVAFPRRRRAIVEDVAEMSIADCTENFLTRHEDDRQVQLRLHVVSHGLVVRGPSGPAVEFGR